MKSYKLVNCEEFESKALSLGAVLYCKEDYRLSDHFACIDKDTKHYYSFNNMSSWDNAHYFQEITQSDFLALPEPIKVGDWCEPNVRLKDVVTIFRYRDGMDSNLCTKLTKQQIEVLGLEEDF